MKEKIMLVKGTDLYNMDWQLIRHFVGLSQRGVLSTNDAISVCFDAGFHFKRGYTILIYDMIYRYMCPFNTL